MKKEKLINKNNTIISKNVSEALNVKKTISSGNIMFVGEQDLTSLILSNILQLNSSFVVTASNNEIVSPDIERFLKSNGYKVKILDLRPIHESSECYNPLKRIKNEDDMCKFVDCIMMDWKSKDDFRRKLVHYLLMAVVAYVLEYNKEDKKNIIELSNFFISNGYAYCEKDDNVYHAFEVIENCSHDSLAYKYYTAYDKSSGKSKKEILSSVLQILQRYGILSYKTFSKDTLTIESMEEEKIALFVIPDSQNSFDAIYSILYMQIIDALFEFEDKNRGSELIPVQLFMNNFAKYTTIPEFGHNLAVMCNYKVSVRLFVKNITQLKEKYSDIWKDMICNCSNIVFCGSSDFETLSYFSEKIYNEKLDINKYKKKKFDFKKIYKEKGILLSKIFKKLNKFPKNKCIVFRNYIGKKEIIIDDKYYLTNHPLASSVSDDNYFKL